jgi:integrase/recombinase XerD
VSLLAHSLVLHSAQSHTSGRTTPQEADQVHHTLEGYLDSYIQAAGIGEDKKGPLFRSALGKTGQLTKRPLDRSDAFQMVRRRARQAGIETQIGNHTFRVTRLTIYLSNGDTLEKAQQMPAHESPRTTKLYDRTRTW